MGKIFNTIEELISDPVFEIKLKDEIKLIHSAHNNRPKPPSGCYYKRYWYDRMSEQSMINTQSFIKHIPEIWEKKSTLPSEFRHVIKSCCDRAAFETFMHYSQESQQTETDNKPE